MAGFVVFDEGVDYLNANGWPPIVYFLLSSRGTANMSAGDRLREGVGETGGDGYRRVPQARPPSLNGKIRFSPVGWQTSGRGWPTDARSLVAATSPDNAGNALCAWGFSETRDMSAMGRTLTVTPVFTN